MSPQVIFRLIRQHILWFILLPILTAGAVYFFTKNLAETYKSQTTLYTGLASGYTLLTDQQINAMDRSSAGFENLITTLNSQETLHQIATSLLAWHVTLEQPAPGVLSAKTFQLLQQTIPQTLRLYLREGNNAGLTYRRVDSLARAPGSNAINALLYKIESPYSVLIIAKKLKASRKANSDMLDIEFESADAAIAQQTLKLAIKILDKRYTALKTAETDAVVNYYESRTTEAKQRLDAAEAQLQGFNVRNQVLNLDQEVKNIADSRETVNTDYYQELSTNKAAKAAFDILDKRVNQLGSQIDAGNVVTARRQELSEAQRKLTSAQFGNQPREVINQLQNQVDRAQAAISKAAGNLYAASNSPEGVTGVSMINDWVAKLVALEESNARLEVARSRLGDYSRRTNNYSPLESQLRQLTRNLSMAERDYLAQNQSLNQARTRRQDILVDGALTVLDAPDLPMESASKRWLFVAIGFVVGLVIAVMLVAIRYMLDRRITSPEQAEQLIGRPLAALFPPVRRFSVESKAGRTALSMFEQLCSAINIEIAKGTNRPYPPIITVFSVRTAQGKTWIANGLARLYAETSQSVAYIYPRDDNSQQRVEQNGITFLPFTIRSNYMNVMSIDDLLEYEHDFDASQYDKIFLELPALISNPFPVALLNKSSVSLLIADANCIWARTEKQLLKMYLQVAQHPILMALNRVDGSYIDAPSMADARQRPTHAEQSLEMHRSLRSLERQRTLRYGKLMS